MSNLNRLKIVLVEQEQTGKWLAEHLASQHIQSVNGVQIHYNQISRH